LIKKKNKTPLKEIKKNIILIMVIKKKRKKKKKKIKRNYNNLYDKENVEKDLFDSINIFSNNEDNKKMKKVKKIPNVNLKQLIISIAKLVSHGKAINNEEFKAKENMLIEYKKMKNETFYIECSKFLMNDNAYVGIFCATQIEHYKTPSQQFVKTVLNCYKSVKNSIVQRLLLNFFKNAKMTKFFDFLLKNLLKDECYIKILNQTIKNSNATIPLNRFDIFMKTNYPNPEMFFKTFKTIIKKTKIPYQILNKKYLGILLSYIYKKKIFGKQTKKGLISLFQTYGKEIHNSFKNKILELLFLSIKKNKKIVIDYYLLYEIIKNYTNLKNISIGSKVIQLFIIPALKLDSSYEEPSIYLKKELYMEEELKDNGVKQFSRMILPYLTKSVNLKKLFMQYHKNKNNAMCLEILIYLTKNTPSMQKQFFGKIYQNHTYNAIRKGSLALKMVHLKMIDFLFIKHNVKFKVSAFFRFLKEYYITGAPEQNSFNLNSIPSVLKLYVVKISIDLLNSKNYFNNFDGDIAHIILFDVLLDSLFFTGIRDEVTIYFYDFLKTNLLHYPSNKKNKIISFIKTNMGSIDFNKSSPMFNYYFFECIAIVIRSLKPIYKSSIESWVLNKYLDKFCMFLMILLYKVKRVKVKTYIIQLLILSNYYNLITYMIEWSKLPKTSEFMYLKIKYEFVELISHKNGIKYCCLDKPGGIRNYITIDTLKDDLPKKQYKSVILKFLSKHIQDKDHRICVYDLLLISINRIFHPFVMDIIIERELDVNKYPSLLIPLVASYMIYKNKDISKEHMKKMVNFLLDNIHKIIDKRQFDLVKKCLQRLNMNTEKLKKKITYDFIDPDNYYEHMNFLSEARLYCMERNSFNFIT
jgi:hypothetical protein